MLDARMTRLAELLVGYSTSVGPGDHLLIEAFDIPEAMVIALVRACRDAGGHPHVALRNNRITRSIIEEADDVQIDAWADHDLHRMKSMQAYIGVRGGHNINELSGVAPDRMQAYGRHYGKPVHLEQRVKNTRWCVLRWPTPSMAQLAQTSTEEFENFYFDVCTLDYRRMADACDLLAARMNRTDRVHIKGPGETDLTFSIKDIPAIPCCGEKNIPDGECYTAPVRDSVNGVIHYNTPTIYQGTAFKNIRLTFEEGRIVDAVSEQNNDRLQDIFNTDDGSRYVGEFAIGFNPYVLEPMMDILFDEKIAGSLHFTPGQAYEEADNSNRSDIHWDLVLIQREDYGGGTIAFDDEVIRENGLFTVDDLQGLNPDALKS